MQQTVLITRPAQQAHALSAEIKKMGGEPLLLPTMVIAAAADPTALRIAIKTLNQQDIALFISPNAVQRSASVINEYWPRWPAQVTIAAMGAGTAKAVQDVNWPAAIYPQQQFNSEELLTLPLLQKVAAKKIILFRGESGRQLVTTTLRARGAVVTEAIAYRCLLPALPALPDIQNVDIIICTSIRSLQNLYELIGGHMRSLLLHKQLLLSSARIAAVACDLGFVKTPLLADNASDAALVKTLLSL
jgi:uroporphyrinogen-III synthase